MSRIQVRTNHPLLPAQPRHNRIFIDGNDAAALGAVYGGATVAAWYPITPSTSMAEAFAKHCKKLRVDPVTKKNRFAIIQSEDIANLAAFRRGPPLKIRFE